ncbi:MAG: response regulator [Methylococcaceae bacterium]|nr:response regulator [Methylococcaceae bacterium]
MRLFTFNIRNKIILLMIFSITLCSFILGAYFLNRIKPLLIEHELITLEKSIDLYKTSFKTQIKVLEKELLTLSKNPLITQVKNNSDSVHNQQWKESLAVIFKDFLQTNPNYLSIHYIAINENNYQEIIRLNRYDDNIINTRIESSLTINEGFIKKAMQLKSDEVYLSDLFLNPKSNTITQAHFPVIRIATPLIDTNSKPLAIIIAEQNAQNLLIDNHPIESSFYVANQEGIYLFHADPNKKPSFDLSLQRNIQKDFPETVSMFAMDNHLATKMLLYPSQQQSHYTFFSKLHHSTHNPEYFLALVLSETAVSLSEKAEEKFYNLIGVLLIVIISFILLSYFFILKLTEPFKELVSASNALSSDFSTINFPTDSNDELAELARSLENMNKKIIQQNESLKNSESMSRSIMNNMSDALMTLTPEGLIHTFNSTAENLFSYSKDEIKGQKASILIPELQVISIQSNVEFNGVSKNGSNLPLEVSITDMKLEYRKTDAKKFFIILCRNIDARKRAEEQIKRAGQLALASKVEAEKANKAKTQFLSRMSHEFRTPLNAVLGFSQILLMDEELDEESMIRPIYDSGTHLLEMVNDVLDISNMEMGSMSFVLETVELTSLLREVYKQSLELAKTTETEIQLSIKNAQSEIFIKVDKERLKQVLLNIISNAIKFNRENGKIILSMRQLNDEKVGISIKDHGIGIDRDNLDLIFSPFERLNAYDLGVDGLGVGLTIAKQLTEKMGGIIGVESAKEVGSRFYVTFPICEPDEKYLMMTELKNTENDINLSIERPVTILYIEDDTINLTFMAKVLGKYSNIKFIPANNPMIGINFARKQTPDLVLLDLHLPEINGFEVFECLKSYPTMQHVPVIAITASKEKEDIDKAMELGFYAYIVKPIKTEELYKTISEALHYGYETKKRYDGEDRRKSHDRRKGDRRK